MINETLYLLQFTTDRVETKNMLTNKLHVTRFNRVPDKQ